MREIKFRAWDKESDRMIIPGDSNEDGYPYSFTADESGMYVESYWDGAEVGQVSREDTTLMQYTGLKDKNGAEIYEGDIVVWNTGERFEVRWFAPHAKFLYRCLKKGYGVDNDAGSHEVEVIGNIYENPELLEKA